MLDDKDKFLHGENGLQFFDDPPVIKSRNPIEEPEGMDKAGTPEGTEGNRPQDPGAQGKPPGVVSLTTIEVQDAICEGPIEGLVSGTYEYAGTAGETGYSSAKFTPYFPIVVGTLGESNADPSGIFRSIHYNNLEVLDKNGRKNFQNVSVSFTNGTPGGIPLVLDANSNKTLEVVRNIGERIRGPEMRYKTSAVDPMDMEMVPGQDPLGRSNAKIYKISNKNCTSFRVNVKVSTFSQTLVDPNLPSSYEEGSNAPLVGRGDSKGVKVIYRIDYRPLFDNDLKNIPFSNKVASTDFSYRSFNPISEELYGKVSAGYIRQTSVTVDKEKFSYALNDKDFIGWEIIIYRETPDSFTTSIRNQTFVDSIVEGYEESYAYPNTAFVRSRFRADSFSQVPSRQFRTRMIKVKVPNNYNPTLRTYGAQRGGSSIQYGGDPGLNSTNENWNGDWRRNADSTIKRMWTDNPAWIFFDLLTNKRYGLGKVLNEDLVDKWNLFEIAKYCDELVPDGYGGVEPRFSANIYISSQADAYQVLNDFSSIFRGISLYAGGQMRAISDKPQLPIYSFSNSNVLGGDFTYSSSSKKARHTVCIVRYNDKEDSFKPSMVYSEDAEGIQKYGFRVKELTAFGCTSKGQALRLAKWVMISEKLETQSISFGAGIEASYLSAGDIIQVSDAGRGNYQNIDARRRSGRTKRVSISGDYTTIELDSSLSGFLENPNIATGDRIVLNLLTPPSYADPLGADLTGSSDSIYIKKSQVQKLLFRKSEVINSGRMDLDAGNPDRLVSIITFEHTLLPSSGNRLDTIGFNVTGFTGLLYDSFGSNITGTGFVESGPDDFIWSIEHTGKNLNITPDVDLYKIVAMQEKENFKFSINAVEHRPEKYKIIDDDLKFEISPGASFPDKPKNIIISSAPIPDTHAVKVSISFSAPDSNSHLAGYKVFVKPYTAFNDVDLNVDYLEDSDHKFPDSEFYYTFINKTANAFDFLPYHNGTYYVRIYSVNTNSKTKAQNEFLEGSFTVDSINLLLDMEVKSLRFQTDPNLNTSANKDAEGAFTSANINVQWQAGFFKESLKDFTTPTDFTYRLTYRKPHPTDNDPNSIILFERTGVSSRTFVDTLSMKENLGINLAGIPSYAGEVTPLREFDVVVEAVDSYGFTSAGGQIIRGVTGNLIVDSLYDNAQGYDIIYVNNSSPPAVHLTDLNLIPDGETCDSPIPNLNEFCTDQWINEDGQFNFIIKKDGKASLISGDIVSAGFLISKRPFTQANIQTKLNTLINDATITSLRTDNVFNTQNDSLTFSRSFSSEMSLPTTFKNFSENSALQADEESSFLTEVYVSAAFLDTFLATAVASEPTKKSLVKKLRFSNVIRVTPRNAFLKDSLLFRAWATLHINWESPDVLSYHSANIDSIDLVEYVAPYTQQLIRHGNCGARYISYSTTDQPRSSRVFTFRNELPSRGYEVIILFTPEATQYGAGVNSAIHTQDLTTKLRIVDKTKSGFTVIDMAGGGIGGGTLKGTFFFGVLLGTSIYKMQGDTQFGSQFNYPALVVDPA